jgi:hypothetical protein
MGEGAADAGLGEGNAILGNRARGGRVVDARARTVLVREYGGRGGIHGGEWTAASTAAGSGIRKRG